MCRRFLVFVGFMLFAFSLVGEAQFKVTKVLETADVGEYNRWVMANKEKYPDLKPVYILGEKIGQRKGIWREAYGTTIKEYRLYYYDENGVLVKMEMVEGHEMEIKFSPSHDRMIIREWKDEGPYGIYYYTVKDSDGREIFTVQSMVRFTPLKNRYILTPPPPPDGLLPIWTKICDEKGTTIGEVKDALFGGEVRVSQDGGRILVYARGGFNNEPDFLIFLDGNGHEVSRKEFMPDRSKGEVWGLRWSMDEDAERIAVGFNGKVYVYDRNWFLLHEYKVPSRVHPSVGLSPDGRYLATFGADILCFFDLERDSLLWQKRLENAGRAKFVRVLGGGRGILVGTKWPAWVYFLDGRGEVVKYEDLGSKEIRKYVKGVPIGRELYESLDYTLDVISGNIVIKVFNKPDAPRGFYSEIWTIEEG